MRIGTPVEQFNISLAHLRSWKRGGSANEITERIPSLLVPIEANTQMQFSLHLRLNRGVWQLATFGSPQFSQMWQRARKAGGQFLVQIESLELAFAGRRVDGKLLLIPLFSDVRLHLEEGKEQPAEKILDGLVEAAVAYKPSVLNSRAR